MDWIALFKIFSVYLVPVIVLIIGAYFKEDLPADFLDKVQLPLKTVKIDAPERILEDGVESIGDNGFSVKIRAKNVNEYRVSITKTGKWNRKLPIFGRLHWLGDEKWELSLALDWIIVSAILATVPTMAVVLTYFDIELVSRTLFSFCFPILFSLVFSVHYAEKRIETGVRELLKTTNLETGIDRTLFSETDKAPNSAKDEFCDKSDPTRHNYR